MIKKLTPLIATVFYIGHLPKAPGTFGSLVGLLIGGSLILIKSPMALWISIGLVCLLGHLFVPLYLEAHPHKKDPSEIVIDEVLGQLIALILCQNIYEMGLAFILFRAFDIWKPWPVSWADGLGGSRFKDTIGIMLDDVLAGLVAAGGIQCLRMFY